MEGKREFRGKNKTLRKNKGRVLKKVQKENVELNDLDYGFKNIYII